MMTMTMMPIVLEAVSVRISSVSTDLNKKG